MNIVPSLISELNLNPDILTVVLDHRGTVLSNNKAFSDFFMKDFYAESFRDSLENKDLNKLLDKLQKSRLNKHKSLMLTLEHQMYQGEMVKIKWQFFVDTDVGDDIFSAIGQLLNPDENSKIISTTAFDYVTDGVFILDREGNFQTVNQCFAIFTSHSKDELLTKNFTDIFGDKKANLYSRQLNRLLYEQKATKSEIYFAGTEEWWFFAIYPSPNYLNVFCKNISERKKYELALKLSQSKLKAILNSTSECNLLLNKDLKVLSFNKAAELMVKRMLGKDISESDSFLNFLPKTDKSKFEEKFKRALEGSTIKHEREVISADGTVYWFRMTFFPVFDENQKIIGVAFNAENIAEHKESEEKLNMYSLIASHITDAVIITDARGLTTWVNEGFIRKTGYTLEDMYGLKPGEVLQGPDTEPEGQLEMHNAVLEGRAFHVEVLNYTKSGKPYHVEIKADPYYRSDGKLLGFIAIQPDITHRKRQEDERIKESWNRFHAIFENSINAILLANDEGLLLDVNPAACNISGYSLDEIRKMTVYDFIDYESEIVEPPNWDTFLSRGKMEGRVVSKTKGGKLKIMDFRAVADILPGLHLSILSDMTSHFLAEQKIKEQNEHLKQLNSEKNQLFSIIAHDLRSPLNSLSGMIDLMEQDFIDKPTFDSQIELLSQRVHHSLSLMDNLFQWAQHQLKGIKLEKRVIDLYEVAQNKLALFKDAADKKSISIHNELETATLVNADFNMIDLVVRNLVANAIKFCSAGGEIRLSSGEEGDTLWMCVSDTGIGIPKENLSKIFGGDISTLGTSKEKGSGLGLKICNDFIKLHGGKIWVESELKKGSSFCFTLPLD